MRLNVPRTASAPGTPRSSPQAGATGRVRALTAAVGAAAALALSPGSIGVAHAADAGLSARWDLDAATLGNGGKSWRFADSSGSGLTAEGWIEPTFVTGKWGNAVRFGAGRGLGVSGAPPGDAAIETPSGTLSLWFRTASAPGEVKYLAAKGSPVSCENASYAIYTGFTAKGTPAEPHNLGLQGYIHDATDTAYTAIAPGNPYDGAWHAVAIVFKDGFVNLYFDGVRSGTRGTYPFLSPGLDIGQPRYDDWPLEIGGNPNPACGDQSFTGTIDEVRFYSRALAGPEIARLHDGSSATPPNADLPPMAPPQPQSPPAEQPSGQSPAPAPATPPAAATPLPPLSASTVLSWKLLRSGRTTLTALSVEGVRDGDGVAITCKGSGCKKTTNRAVTLKGVKKGRVSLRSAVKGLSLRPKATLTVTISRSGHASRVITYRTVSRKDPRRSSRCQTPGAKTTYVC